MLIDPSCVIQHGKPTSLKGAINIYKNTNNIVKTKKKEQARQMREEKRKVLKPHIVSLVDIKHEQCVPIKKPVAKNKASLNINYTDRCLRKSIEYGIGDVPMIQKSRTDGYVVKSD